MMSLEVNLPIEDALNLGWETLSECFEKNEVGIKDSLLNKSWPANTLT
jgi:V/A-type H+-transporting ATPase subunit B